MTRERGTVFRVFVSSTFADFVEERNALDERVFPRLRRLCQRRGASFQAIDLRWGVSAEASLDHRTLNVCFEELARCQRLSPRPNFIVLLGDRYGWRPLPPYISDDEWELIVSRCTEREMDELREWYVHDGNAARRRAGRVVAEWILRSRVGLCEDDVAWRKVESRLLPFLHRGTRDLSSSSGSPEVAPGLKYGASATEQEIHRGALAVPDACQHVFGFFRTITNLERLVLDAESIPKARDYADFDPDHGWAHDRFAHDRVLALRQTLIDRLPGQIKSYSAVWDGKEAQLRRLEVDRLCKDVFRRLAAIIVSESKSHTTVTPLQRECDRHGAFAVQTASPFVGREKTLRQVEEYLGSDAKHPLVLWGPPGSGKSALMAHAARCARERQGNAVIVARYLGATAASTRLQPLLASICDEIARALGIQVDVSAGPAEMVSEFARCLESARPETPLILFVDGLERLTEEAASRGLAWIPPAPQLPAHVRLVLSVAAAEPPAPFSERFGEAAICALPRMTASEGELLLDRWLDQAGRTLSPSQREAVLTGFRACPSPLYLRLAFEEAREWHSFSPVEETRLARDERELVLRRLERLSSPSRHGAKLVDRCLAYLASARSGLAEDELVATLSLDPEVIAELRHLGRKSPEFAQVPPVIWARLYSDIEPYLFEMRAPGAPVLVLRDQMVADIVREIYLSDSQQRCQRHAALASLFLWPKPVLSKNDPRSVPSETRRLYESAFQSAAAGDWTSLHDRLTSPSFLSSTCVSPELGVDRMLADLRHAGGEWQRQSGRAGPPDPNVADYDALFSLLWAEAPSIRRHDTLAFQQLWHRVRWSSRVGQECKRRFDVHAESIRRAGQTLVRSRTSPSHITGTRVQEIRIGDRPGPLTVALSPLGLLVFEQSGRWIVLDSEGVVRQEGLGAPGGLRYLDANDRHVVGVAGQNVALWRGLPTEPPFLFRTGWPIAGLALAAGSSRLVVSAESGEWVLYDLTQARPTRMRQGTISGRPSAVTIAPDGRQWLLGTDGGQVWRGSLDGEILPLSRHAGEVRALSLSSDGQRYAVVLGTGHLEVIAVSGCVRLHGETGVGITCAILEEDGRVVISVDERGACSRRSESTAWQTEVLAEAGSYASWVGVFPGVEAIAVLHEQGVLRILHPPDLGFPAQPHNSMPRDAVAGIAPLAEGKTLLAERRGMLWEVPAGDVTTALPIGDAGGALRALHGIGSSEGLLVFEGRSRSYLARCSTSDPPMNLGPPDDLPEHTVHLMLSSVSPDGRYLLVGCRTVEGAKRTRLQAFTISPWRRIWERWMEGWCTGALIADSGQIAVDAGWYSRPFSISIRSEETIAGPFELGGPLAVDGTGQRVLLTDGAMGAWLLLNGMASPPVKLLPGIRTAALSRDGRVGVLIDSAGFVRMFEPREDESPPIRWTGCFPLEWAPEGCTIVAERREIWAWGSRGFAALAWDIPIVKEVQE